MVDSILAVFPDARVHSGYARVRCPYHKDGQEKNPSMGILLEQRNKMQAGTCHCFTCGKVVPLEQLLKDVGAAPQEIARSGARKGKSIQPLQTDQAIYKPQIPYRFSQYLAGRGIGEKVQKLFKVYEKDGKVHMPVFDRNGKFLYSNARSVVSKQFFISTGAVKTLWGIEVIDLSKPIVICESQIDAMSLWEIGIQAVATLGADNTASLKMLLESTSTFVLAFDPDEAGRRATQESINILGAWRCSYVELPQKVDINQALQDIEDHDKFKQFILSRTKKVKNIVQ